MSDQKMKIEFAPGVLEGMEAEMSNEDLQDLLNHIKELVDSGTLEEHSKPIDMEKLCIEDPELFTILQERLLGLEDESQPTIH